MTTTFFVRISEPAFLFHALRKNVVFMFAPPAQLNFQCFDHFWMGCEGRAMGVSGTLVKGVRLGVSVLCQGEDGKINGTICD